MIDLKLVLKKKWYDMIASGEKTEEYREIKPYYDSRLIGYSGRVPFGHYRRYFIKPLTVTFYLGYAKDRPSMSFLIKDIVAGVGREDWGAKPNERCYIIKLGERLM